MNIFKRLLLIFGCLFLLSAVKPEYFKVTGIQGDSLRNVESRLTELYRQDSILKEPTEALQDQIRKALQPYGYFRAKIYINRTTGRRLLIHITPGPQMLITSLTLKVEGPGADNIEIKQAVRDIPIKSGQPFNNQLYEESKSNLISAAEHQGYLRAKFETSEVLIDRQHYTTHITLVFNTGLQYYFGQIRFDPTYISPQLLARYIPFKPGQPYSTDQLLELNSNLSASGYFKSVIVKPDTEAGRNVPVEVHLARVPRYNYSLGIGYGTDTGPRGRAGLHVVPVNRDGHKFNLLAQGSTKENALLGQYVIPGQNPVADKYSITGGLSNLDYTSGYSTSMQLSLAHQHAVTNHQRILALNALHERYNYSYMGLTKNNKTLLFPQATLSWRHVTDQLFSPYGYNITLAGFAASKALLSDVNVAQATIDAKAAITIQAIRTRFYFHGIQGFTGISDINNLPLSLAMLLGGAENLQAYGFNSIGPGKIMTYGGIEVQKEARNKWYLVGFIDSGDVYKPSLKDFKYDVGAGIMWVSPVGPIKVAVAQAVNNHFGRIQDRNPRLVVNMGPDL